jgi:rhamnogalacturonyl hydrolase YesR
VILSPTAGNFLPDDFLVLYPAMTNVPAVFLSLLSLALAACATSGGGAARREAAAAPAADTFGAWPAGASPTEVGTRVVKNYLARPLPTGAVHYAEACTWYGALAFTKLAANAGVDDQLIARFAPILQPAGGALIPARDHVDDRVFGIVPLEIYIHNHDQRYLAMGQGLADLQWAKTTPDGIATEARYWVDDMWMITALQAQAFRATAMTVYLDRAATTMAAYLDRLQQPNGLFFHTAQSPQHWGRGNGWFAAGMAELLRTLPAAHPERARIMAGYTKMMAGLLGYQTSTGLWRQLIDRPESWVETSSSAMFTYAMVTGVKSGWLDPATYGPAARKAWLDLVTYLDADANLKDVCVGTGEAYGVVGGDRNAQVKYYLDRGRSVGDFHGQAPVLWSAAELLR